MTGWKVKYHKDAYKFLHKENFLEAFEEALKDFIYKSRKVDIKKLKGKWKGKYRIRIGNIRVVFDINYDERTIYIVRAGYRGDVYK